MAMGLKVMEAPKPEKTETENAIKRIPWEHLLLKEGTNLKVR